MTKREQTYKELEFEPNEKIDFPILDIEEAKKANKVMFLCNDIVVDIVKNTTKKIFENTKKNIGRTRWECRLNSIDEQNNWYGIFEWAYNVDNNLMIEIDPFGTYLQDGQPCIWISHQIGKENVQNYLNQVEMRFGTHISFDDCNYYKFINRADLNEDLKTSLLENLKNVWVCHKIILADRCEYELQEEIEYYIKEAVNFEKAIMTD